MVESRGELAFLVICAGPIIAFLSVVAYLVLLNLVLDIPSEDPGPGEGFFFLGTLILAPASWAISALYFVRSYEQAKHGRT